MKPVTFLPKKAIELHRCSPDHNHTDDIISAVEYFFHQIQTGWTANEAVHQMMGSYGWRIVNEAIIAINRNAHKFKKTPFYDTIILLKKIITV